MEISPLPPVSNESRVTLGIQFGWGRFNSRVSSRLTIFAIGGIKSETAFKVVVFPEAVPPAKIADLPFSTASQIYAIERGTNVCHSMRSVGVIGYALNFRMVNVDP
jgi:hypothetical protein